jgi:tetratricopeptide (TPR) repeat protein
MRSIRAVCLAMGLCVLWASGAEGAANWVEVKSGHFTVFTNSGENEGRHTAWQFEQIREALLLVWPWANIDGGKPFEVFAVRDENSLKALGPQFWEGKQYRPGSFWVASPDREYVAMRTDFPEPSEEGTNPYQAAYFAYVSMVLNRSMPAKTPAWYRRGLAEVISNTLVRAKEVHVGRIMNEHLTRVRDGGLIPFEEFMTARGRSKWLTQEADARLFDAQAWAFVHYLMVGNEGANAPRLNRFNKLLMEGTDSDVAMKEAFGEKPPDIAALRSYVQRGIFQYMRAKVDLRVKAEGFTVAPLSTGAAATARGRLLAAMRRPVEARALAQEARVSDAASPGPDEIEGTVLDAENKIDEAKASYARAVERGSKRGYVFYRLAQLEVGYGVTDKAKLERGVALLSKANELEPTYANAFSYHAQMKTDLGSNDEALQLALQAVKLEPNQTYHRLTGARALFNGGNKEDAIAAARIALQVADTDRERDDAQRFLDFAMKSEPPRPKAASTPTPR